MIARCPRCLHDPELRKEWGCDDLAPDPVIFITCAHCNGYNPECSMCGGSGEQPMYRCPQFYLEPSITEALQAYGDYDQHGQWPIGWHRREQSVEFLHFVEIVGAERDVLMKELQDG